MSYLDQNSLLFHNQHGFRSRVSCETQFIQFTQDLYDTLNQGGQTDVIVMDFSKAFDKVDHQRLLLKLHRLGINTTVIAWIKSFLSGQITECGPRRGTVWCLPSAVWGASGIRTWALPFSHVHKRHARLNQKQHQAVSTTPSCTLPSQIIQTVKPYNQTLPLSNPGRVNGLWHSILRSVKSLGSQKRKK